VTHSSGNLSPKKSISRIQFQSVLFCLLARDSGDTIPQHWSRIYLFEALRYKLRTRICSGKAFSSKSETLSRASECHLTGLKASGSGSRPQSLLALVWKYLERLAPTNKPWLDCTAEFFELRRPQNRDFGQPRQAAMISKMRGFECRGSMIAGGRAMVRTAAHATHNFRNGTLRNK